MEKKKLETANGDAESGYTSDESDKDHNKKNGKGNDDDSDGSDSDSDYDMEQMQSLKKPTTAAPKSKNSR